MMNGAPYMVMPGARIGVENGKLVESLGQSHLAGITGPPTYGIGTGIGTQAMANYEPTHQCCPSCPPGLPCGLGQDKKSSPFVMLAIVVGSVWLGTKMLTNL